MLRTEEWKEYVGVGKNHKSSQPNLSYSLICLLQKGKNSTGHTQVSTGTALMVGTSHAAPKHW